MKFLLKNATLIDAKSPFHLQTHDLLIDNGKLIALGEQLDEQDAKVLQFDNLHVSNAWFDPSVSFGEPGYEERETLENGLLTAAKSGFGAVLLNSNTHPALDTHASIQHLLNKTASAATKLYVTAALSKGGQGEQIAELNDLHVAGAKAFGDYKNQQQNTHLLRIALDYAQSFEGIIHAYPMETSLSQRGLMHEGEQSIHMGVRGIPTIAETIALARDLELLAYTKGKMHLNFISSAKGVELVREAKQKGLRVSASVALPHLLYTDLELQGFNSAFKIEPPLRHKDDRQALRAALLDGTIDMVTALHEPLNIELKQLEFEYSTPGSLGLEAAFGLLNSIFTLEKTIAFLTRGKTFFGIPNPAIKEGVEAAFTLFNPTEQYTLTEAHLHSTSKNCMHLGQQMQGKVIGCLMGNQFVENK